MAVDWTSRSDAELLRASRIDPEAFGAFYARYEAVVATFLARRSRDRELSADLTAETFAAAWLGHDKFDDNGRPAIGWLLGIAQNLLLRAWRRGRADASARQRLGATASACDESLERVESLIDGEYARAALDTALAELPDLLREAVTAYVIDERPYRELAVDFGVPETTVRQRVSRGLARMRTSHGGMLR